MLYNRSMRLLLLDDLLLLPIWRRSMATRLRSVKMTATMSWALGFLRSRSGTSLQSSSGSRYAVPLPAKRIRLTLSQVYMNFNTSIYNNGAHGMAEEFGVSDQVAKIGSAIFLIMYAFGCELWAPWSEEFGRKPVLQASMTLVNIFQLPVALAPNMGAVIAGRALGGLSTAGGSVTLGMVADLWEPENQQYAVAYVVFSSVGGSILGPIFGGFLEKYANWRYVSFLPC